MKEESNVAISNEIVREGLIEKINLIQELKERTLPVIWGRSVLGIFKVR